MPLKGFLKIIKEVKENELQNLLKNISLDTIRTRAEARESSADFKEAVERAVNLKRPGIIAEIKKASPSKGDINRDIDPEVFAKKYEKAGAIAISVLTEQFYFKGSAADLAAAAGSVSIPVLRKDFVISSLQIYEAKSLGASAVLLINKLLEENQLRDYTALVRQLDMEALVEIHSEGEIEQAVNAGAKIIGINNRNLETLKTDTGVAKRVVSSLAEGIIPVAASGISSTEDIREGMTTGIYNFLIGESVVRAENPENFIEKLIHA